MSAQIQIAAVGGRSMRYLEGGEPRSGNVLVLAHAFPVGAALFEPQLDAFPGWRVIVPALPGFNGSERLDRPTIDAYAGQVLSLMDTLGVERAVIGGVSMGGHLTFAAFRQAPARIRGAILADTRSPADTDETRVARRRMLQIVDAEGPAGAAREMVPRLIGKTSQAERPEVVARVRALIEGQDSGGISDAIQVLMSRPDSTPMLGAIGVPCLVLVGEEDGLSPPSEMEGLARAIPRSTFVRIDRAGHLANLEQPALFNQAVAGWLESITSG